MKRFLLLALTAGLFSPVHSFPNSKQDRWPTSWREFKYPPHKDSRPYAVVYFTNSIEEACKEFEKASKLFDLFDKRHDEVVQRYLGKGLSREEWIKKTGPAWEDEWPREMKRLATAVEVLRQADYPDWKLYSRWNLYGVGDIRRGKLRNEEMPSINDPIGEYQYMAPKEAKDVCKQFGFSF